MMRILTKALMILLLSSLSLSLSSISVGVSMSSSVHSGSTSVWGYISENTTWTLAGNPYIVVGDVIVEPNVSLTIEPGVVVKFTNGTNLLVDGALIAQGNSSYKIAFTSNAATPQQGDWGAIRLRGPSYISKFNWDVIEYATSGISLESSSQSISDSVFSHNLDGVKSSSSDVSIIDSDFNNNNQGISYPYSHPEMFVKVSVAHSAFSNNDYGIYSNVWNGNFSVSNSTFSGNVNGIFIYYLASILVSHSVFLNNTNGIYGGYRASISVVDSQFLQNTNGIALTGTSAADISVSQSVFLNNRNGIYVPGAESVGISVFHSIISNNTNGIEAVGGITYSLSTLVSVSILSDNKVSGIRTFGSLSMENSTVINNGNGTLVKAGGTIHHSNIHDNTQFNMVNLGWPTINATENWWGITNETQIEQSIHDYYDDYTVGKVFYKPYLPGPIGNTTLLDFSLTPNPTYVGQQVTLSGRLTDLFSDPIGNAKIELSYSIDGGGNWTGIGSVVTNMTGFFGGKGAIGSAGTYLVKAYCNGSETYSSSSHIETLTVLNKASTHIFLRLTPNPASPGQKVTFTGILVDEYSTPVKSASIMLQYSTDYGLTWHPAGTLTTNQYGIFSMSFTAPPAGVYLIRSIYNGSPSYDPSSADIPLVVR